MVAAEPDRYVVERDGGDAPLVGEQTRQRPVGEVTRPREHRMRLARARRETSSRMPMRIVEDCAMATEPPSGPVAADMDDVETPPWRLMRLLDGYVTTQLLYVAAKLDIASVLAERRRRRSSTPSTSPGSGASSTSAVDAGCSHVSSTTGTTPTPGGSWRPVAWPCDRTKPSLLDYPWVGTLTAPRLHALEAVAELALRRVADSRRSLVASRPVLAATRPRNAPRCVSTRSVADNAPDVS